MSGGSFDYAYAKVAEFCEQLDLWINVDETNEYRREFFSGLKPSTQKMLRDLKAEAEVIAEQMKAVEWFISGDTVEEGFQREMMNIELSRFTK